MIGSGGGRGGGMGEVCRDSLPGRINPVPSVTSLCDNGDGSDATALQEYLVGTTFLLCTA